MLGPTGRAGSKRRTATHHLAARRVQQAALEHLVRFMYIFNHIPKCGGLSYRALLEEIFGQDRVTHISINLEEEYHPDPDEYRQYTMLMGHFGVRWNEIVGPGRRWMTALREPIDRVVSTYYYWRHNTPVSPESPWVYLAQTMSLDELIRSGHYLVLQGIKNVQTWQLADDLRWRYRTVPEQDALAVAKQNLDKFDLVGIYEEFERSVECMCKYLGVTAPSTLPRVNVTKKRFAVSELNPATIEAIMELNTADMELYKYALKRFYSPVRPSEPATSIGCSPPGRIDAGREALRMLPVSAERASALRLWTLSVPSTCPCGKVIEAIVEVFNGGLGIWSSAPPNPLFLSYHWLTDNRELCIFDGWRSEIRPPLQRFSAERFRMHVLAPATPGVYRLRITLVQESVRWFDDSPLSCWEDIRVVVTFSQI